MPNTALFVTKPTDCETRQGKLAAFLRNRVDALHGSNKSVFRLDDGGYLAVVDMVLKPDCAKLSAALLLELGPLSGAQRAQILDRIEEIIYRETGVPVYTNPHGVEIPAP